VPVEVVKCIATISAKTHDEDAVRGEVSGYRGENVRLCVRSNEGHHVSRQNRAGEWLDDAMSGEVELGQVGDQPLRAGMILSGGGDQLRISVDPDDLVASLMEQGTDPTGAAAGIEDARPWREHGI
jgi:hypothetical protein